MKGRSYKDYQYVWLADKIKTIQKLIHYKDKDMANLIGVGERTYQAYKYGQVVIPTIHLITLINKLNVNPEYLTYSHIKGPVFIGEDSGNDDSSIDKMKYIFEKENIEKDNHFRVEMLLVISDMLREIYLDLR